MVFYKKKSSIKKYNKKDEKLNFEDKEASKKLKQTSDQSKNYEKQLIIDFIQNYPIISVLTIMLILVIMILAIIIPLTLVTRKEDRAIISR